MSQLKEFTFPSDTGNNTIHAVKCVPDGQPRGIVQIAHGITERVSVYEEFMHFLADNGFIAVGNDHLGHGLSAKDESEIAFFSDENGWEHALKDMDTLHDMTVKEHGAEVPYIFFGHSMGSFLTRSYLIKYPEKADMAVLCGTGHQSRIKLTAARNLSNNIVRIKGAKFVSERLYKLVFGTSSKNSNESGEKKKNWLTRDTQALKKFKEDPSVGFVPTASLFRDLFDGMLLMTDSDNIAQMKKDTPVLFISGDDDPVGEFAEGVIRAYEAFRKAGMTSAKVILYPGAKHELICETNKDEIIKDVLNWIESNI